MARQNFLRNTRFRYYLFLNGAVVLAVLAIFHWIADREIAAVCAGTLFILSPLAVIFCEWALVGTYRSASAYMAAFFLLTCAIPIFVLRVTNWGRPFAELQIFGVPAPQMHGISNFVFLLMLLGFVVDSLRLRRNPNL